MTGTLLNVVAILTGGGAGMAFGARLPDRIRESSVSAMGLFIVALGVENEGLLKVLVKAGIVEDMGVE